MHETPLNRECPAVTVWYKQKRTFSTRNSTKFALKLPNLDTFSDSKIPKNFPPLYG